MVPRESGPPAIVVVVAVIMNADRQYLWTWNDAWGVFALPMTRRRSGSGREELPAHAAARAAAEALGVPVRIGPHWMAAPAVRVSGRDLADREYAFDLYRAEPHPKFAAALQVRRPYVWLSADEALSGEYRPLSPPCLELLTRAVVQGQLPGRIQHTVALVVRRGGPDDRRYLLRWHADWGYSLPMARRAPGEPAPDVAHRLATEELGLAPGRDVALASARVESLTTRGPSPTAGVPTYYLHALFEASLNPGACLVSSEPLVWASKDEILRGETAAAEPVPGSPPAPPGKVSRTAFRILTATDEVPWIDTTVALP